MANPSPDLMAFNVEITIINLRHATGESFSFVTRNPLRKLPTAAAITIVVPTIMYYIIIQNNL